jgi:hypothetical protein
VQEKEMVGIFTPLIKNVVSILEGTLKTLSDKANNDKQSLMMALLSVLQRTSSTLLA